MDHESAIKYHYYLFCHLLRLRTVNSQAKQSFFIAVFICCPCQHYHILLWHYATFFKQNAYWAITHFKQPFRETAVRIHCLREASQYWCRDPTVSFIAERLSQNFLGRNAASRNVTKSLRFSHDSFSFSGTSAFYAAAHSTHIFITEQFVVISFNLRPNMEHFII